MRIITTLIFVLSLGSILAQTVSTFPSGTPDDAIAIDSNGNIYASGFTTGTVFKYDTQGTMSEFITGLSNPNGLAFDSNDNLYVSEWGDNMIHRYDINGNLEASQIITGNPSGMIKAFDNDDMIYTRYNGNTINRITPQGIITEVSSDAALNGPVGLAYDEVGNLYVANYNNRQIFRVLGNGDLEYIAAPGGFSNVGFIAYAQGMLWATVLGEHKIYRIDPNETDEVMLFAGSTVGSTDGPIASATFSQPNGIAFTSDEATMFVTDFGTKNLRVISDITLGVSTDGLPKESLWLYPNPADDQIRVRLDLGVNEAVSLRIWNSSGILVKQYEVEWNGRQHFDLAVDTLGSGLYFVELSAGTETFTKRFIKN